MRTLGLSIGNEGAALPLVPGFDTLLGGSGRNEGKGGRKFEVDLGATWPTFTLGVVKLSSLKVEM